MLKCVLGAAVLVAAAGVANAGFTPVNTGSTFGGGSGTPSAEGRPGPTSVVSIMSAIYRGGNFDTTGITGNVAGTLNFGNGVTAVRVHDFMGVNPTGLGADLNLGTGNNPGVSTDQVWTDGTASFRARARYAGDRQFFGVRNGLTRGAFSTVSQLPSGTFTSQEVSAGLNTGSNSPTILVGPGQFQWMRSPQANGAATGSGGGFQSYSLAANNTGNQNPPSNPGSAAARDFMVTWQIFGLGGMPRYIIAFEDRYGGDGDFNDLVLEIQTIPLPTGVGLALAGMGVVGGIRRRRSAL